MIKELIRSIDDLVSVIKSEFNLTDDKAREILATALKDEAIISYILDKAYDLLVNPDGTVRG